ncbi:GAF domain-containing protein [Myxococcota bacterium]|nr:GAF domain-containing protein [Myxococcota bacterium]
MMIRTLHSLLLFLALVLIPTGAHAQLNSPDDILNLSGLWLHQVGDHPNFASIDHDDSSWSVRRLPNKSPKAEAEWHGWGWYRKHITLSTDVLFSDLEIVLGQTRYIVSVYLNGHLIGGRGSFEPVLRGAGSIDPLRLMIPKRLLKAGNNLIALRIYDPTFSRGISSGDLLLGDPSHISELVDTRYTLEHLLIWLLTLASLIAAFLNFAVDARRRSQVEKTWLAMSALGLALYFSAGIGLLEVLVSPIALAARLPDVGLGFAIWGIFGFFSTHYDDWGKQTTKIPRMLLGSLPAFALLAPQMWMLSIYEPLLVAFGFAVAIYILVRLIQARRRRELTGISLFTIQIFVLLALIYDLMVQHPMGPLTFISPFFLLILIGANIVILAINVGNDHDDVLRIIEEKSKHAENHPRMSLLDAFNPSEENHLQVLSAITQEIARELGVMRCSIVVPSNPGTLKILASTGIPTEMRNQTIDAQSSISGRVFSSGKTLSSYDMGEEKITLVSRTSHATSSFVSHPVLQGSQVIAVLNISDRQDGRVLDADQRLQVSFLATKLSVLMSTLENIRKGQNAS